MKQIMKITWLLPVFVLLTSFQFGWAADTKNELPAVRVVATGYGQKFALELTGLNSTCQIRIEDKQGFVLLQEAVEATDLYRKMFNLEQLPVGTYNLLLRIDHREIVQPFSIANGSVQISSNRRFTRFLPVVQVRDDQMLAFSLLNRRIDGAYLCLRDQDDNLWYEEQLSPKLSQERLLDLSQLPAGNYSLTVRTNEGTYYEYFKL